MPEANNNKSVGFRLGQLYAVISEGAPDSMYIACKMGDAMCTPSQTFPLLLNRAKQNLARRRRNEKRTVERIERQMEEIIAKLERFPAYLSDIGKGDFVFGVVHQKRSSAIAVRALRAATVEPSAAA